MIDPKRREMFFDLYRMAEYYEQPPFRAGDIDGNADWFMTSNEEQLRPFLTKYADQLAMDLAMAVVDEASRKAAELNKM
ncbi:MAG: hypothetical protein J6S83_12010 [Lachnospiraceae bacterium]|nr:hypothetical protein [Lachnospiraceae bacterium]